MAMSEVSSERTLQEQQPGEEDWKERLYASEPPPQDGSDAGPSVTLEGTINVVTENIWSFGDAALKSVAEVLVGFGISPSILGYSEEELLDEGLEGAQMRIRKDQVLSKSSFAMRSEEHINRRRAEEEEPEEAAEEVYAREELRSSSWGGSSSDLTEEGGFGEDKKDK